MGNILCGPTNNKSNLENIVEPIKDEAVVLQNEEQFVLQKEEVVKVGADLNYTKMKKIQEPNIISKVFDDFKNVDILTITFCFLFYFLAGYLLYAALFAAVGSAVDNEADTQQFMVPITIPLVLSFLVAQNVIQDPQSTMAFWFSIVPLTSPIVMMVRLPFGVPFWEVALSIS